MPSTNPDGSLAFPGGWFIGGSVRVHVQRDARVRRRGRHAGENVSGDELGRGSRLRGLSARPAGGGRIERGQLRAVGRAQRSRRRRGWPISRRISPRASARRSRPRARAAMRCRPGGREWRLLRERMSAASPAGAGDLRRDLHVGVLGDARRVRRARAQRDAGRLPATLALTARRTRWRERAPPSRTRVRCARRPGTARRPFLGARARRRRLSWRARNCARARRAARSTGARAAAPGRRRNTTRRTSASPSS